MLSLKRHADVSTGFLHVGYMYVVDITASDNADDIPAAVHQIWRMASASAVLAIASMNSARRETLN